MLRAYSAIPLHCLFVLPQEVEFLQQFDGKFPQSTVILNSPSGIVKRWTIDGKNAALLGFPPDSKKGEVSDQTMAEVAAKAEELSKDSDLVIAVSPWGGDLEKRFVQLYPKVVDLLLGSGQGRTAKAEQLSPRTYWAPTYTRGKSLLIITMNQWPTKAAGDWNNLGNYSTYVQALGDNIPDDPDVKAIIDTVPAKEAASETKS